MNCRKGAKINIFAANSSIRYIVALGNALLYALLYKKGDCRFYALRWWLLYKTKYRRLSILGPKKFSI